MAHEAAQHFAALGFVMPADRLRVLRDEAGLVVVPVGTGFGLQADGQGRRSVVPIAEGQPAHTLPADQAVAFTLAGTTQWVTANSQCFARISDTYSWLDHCYILYFLANDGDPNKDYYGLKHYATARANSPWYLRSAAIGNYPARAVQTWVEFNPIGASFGNCRSMGLGVSALGFGLSGSFTACETIDVVKQNPDVNFVEMWYVDLSGVQTSRGLQYLITVKVKQGVAPAFYLPAEVHGTIFALG